MNLERDELLYPSRAKFLPDQETVNMILIELEKEGELTTEDLGEKFDMIPVEQSVFMAEAERQGVAKVDHTSALRPLGIRTDDGW